jgi:YHS domain-containing protein
MEALAVVIEVILFYMIIKTTFRIIILFKTAKKVKEKANNQELSRVATPIDVVEKKVYDEICGATLTRSNSYILVEDDKEHYFCCWECRQKYLDNAASIT